MSSVIELHAIGKRYWKLRERAKLSQAVLPFVSARREELWALRGVDLEVSAGETLGVLGHNGAGKTTLLRLLAGVTSPTEGRLRVTGRIAPLISLGVGFHQEMSGRENVLVNGMLLGLSAEQVAERFDSIVAFAELEEFIDTPVKFYSSGMFMRLGFAVVVHSDPAVLLVDEILAVGDAAFQLKCLNRLRRLREDGTAIVVVSHSLQTIRQLCRRAVLMRRGELIYDGPAERAIAMHFESASRRGLAGETDSGVGFVACEMAGGSGDGHHADRDDPVELRARLQVAEARAGTRLVLTLETDTGYPVSRETMAMPESVAPGGVLPGGEVDLRVGFRARLGGGNYRLTLTLTDERGHPLATGPGLMLFVAGRPSSIGVVELSPTFSVDGDDRTDRRAMIFGS